METIEQTLAQELEAAERGELQEVQARALQFYNAEPGTVPKGWSDLVSADVRDAVESSLAEIIGAIDPNEPLAFFRSEGAEDVEKSELESRAVHDSIFQSNRGMLIVEQAIRDALLQRYGIIKCWIDERTSKATKTLENLGPQELDAIVGAQQEQGETLEVSELTDNKDGTFNIRLRYSKTDRRLVLAGVAPENFRWSSDLRSGNLADARFLAERELITRDALAVRWSQEKADDAPGGAPDDPVSLERNPEQGAAAGTSGGEEIELWICWMRDLVNGGYDCYEFIEPATIGKKYRRQFHPYAGGVVTMRPHRFDGVSVYDRIGPIQEAKTFLLRQLATQARLTNQTRLVIRDRTVNPEDVNSEDLNPVFRVTGAPADCIMPIPVLDVSSQLLASLQWIDKVRRESGGASIDMASPELQIAGQSAHAAEREYSFRELQSGAMLRTIGDTLMRSLYLLVHATMRAELAGPRVMQEGREWVSFDPQAWPKRVDLVVDIGQPLGVRSRRMQALASTISLQQAVLQSGGAGMLVSLPDMYAAAVDMGKLAGLRDAARYWTDPDSPEAVAKAKAQQQQAQQAAQAQAAQQQAVIAATKEIETLKSETEILKQRMQDANELQKARMSEQRQYFEAILQAMAAGASADVAAAAMAAGKAGEGTEKADGDADE